MIRRQPFVHRVYQVIEEAGFTYRAVKNLGIMRGKRTLRRFAIDFFLRRGRGKEAAGTLLGFSLIESPNTAFYAVYPLIRRRKPSIGFVVGQFQMQESPLP